MHLNTYALRAWRKERDLSITQLAAAVPMPQPNLSKMEAGEEQPSYARLVRIAQVLGTTPQALVGPDEPLVDLEPVWPFIRGRKRSAA